MATAATMLWLATNRSQWKGCSRAPPKGRTPRPTWHDPYQVRTQLDQSPVGTLAPPPPSHARSGRKRRHGGPRTHTKRRIPTRLRWTLGQPTYATPDCTSLLPGKRVALQVLLAWNLMCMCPPEDLGMGGGIGLSAASWHYIETSFRPILSPRASTRAQRPREP